MEAHGLMDKEIELIRNGHMAYLSCFATGLYPNQVYHDCNSIKRVTQAYELLQSLSHLMAWNQSASVWSLR
jgi:hypothetical protein